MNFKRVSPMIAVLVASSLVYGCSASAINQNQLVASTNSIQQVKAEVNEKAQTVQVESISGNQVTAVLGKLTQEGPPALPTGEAPTGEKPPTLPTGEAPTGEKPPTPPTGQVPTGETPPAKPEGEAFQAGGMNGATVFESSGDKITFTINNATDITVEMLQSTQKGSLESVVVNSVLEVTLDESNTATSITVKNLMAGEGFGGSHTPTHGTSSTTIDQDSSIKDQRFTSSSDDDNALRIDSAKVSLESITVEKLAGESSNTENGDFYGQNAGLLAMNGAQVTINNATVNTATTNGNGIFSYGEGTVVTVSDSSINTSARNSGGIQTTGGGTMNASNLIINTQGDSAAAIRSDRGGGIVNVVGGTYTTNGIGSPAIYSTANISVADAVLIANNSEGIVIEGKNSVNLINSTLTGNMNGSHLEASESIHNIMIYQSMSGDAEIGHSTFTAQGGAITAKAGDMFYVTNTTCTIELTDVDLSLANDVVLKVAGNETSRGWGTKGSNGGKCTFIATDQTLEGNIIVDEISTLDLTMKEGSVFNGSINQEGNEGEVKVTMDSTSKWVLTGDTYITEFNGNRNNIVNNGFKLYIGGKLA